MARLFLLAVSIANLGWSAASVTTIAGRPVNLDLVKADDLSHAAWPDGGFELTTEAVTTQVAANIYDLLSAEGIEPDVEAFTLVYDLNPSLKAVDPLANGLNLTLPRARGGNRLRDKLQHGYLVMLTVDRPLRDELGKTASELQDISARFAKIPAEQFTDPSTSEMMTKEVKALASWFAYVHKTFLQRTGPPLRRQTLQGMRDEALALNSILAEIIEGREAVTPADRKQVDAIYKDIQIQMKKYDNIMSGEPPAGDERYEVVVTIRNRDASLVDGIQVYYTWEGLFRSPPRRTAVEPAL